MAEAGPRLYLITPVLSAAAEFAPVLQAALAAGDVACVFLRLAPLAGADLKKLVTALTPLAQHRGAAVLLEDPQLAGRCGADGVHVARPGPELDAALAAMKPEGIVGVGGIASRHEAMIAGESGVDYVMFGGASGMPEADLHSAEILEQTAWWAEIFTVPCVAYAHSFGDVADLVRAGADFIALGDFVWRDPDGPAAAVTAVMQALVPSREPFP